MLSTGSTAVSDSLSCMRVKIPCDEGYVALQHRGLSSLNHAYRFLLLLQILRDTSRYSRAGHPEKKKDFRE
jgi:uncharacterized protein (DUF1786 family)